MSYTVEEIKQLITTCDGVATLFEAVDTRDGGGIEPPILIQVISGCYSKSEENAILSAIKHTITSYYAKLNVEKQRGLSDSNEVSKIYLKYIDKCETINSLVKLCIDKHLSTKLEDRKICNIVYTILAKAIPGAW